MCHEWSPSWPSLVNSPSRLDPESLPGQRLTSGTAEKATAAECSSVSKRDPCGWRCQATPVSGTEPGKRYHPEHCSEDQQLKCTPSGPTCAETPHREPPTATKVGIFLHQRHQVWTASCKLPSCQTYPFTETMISFLGLFNTALPQK